MQGICPISTKSIRICCPVVCAGSPSGRLSATTVPSKLRYARSSRLRQRDLVETAPPTMAHQSHVRNERSGWLSWDALRRAVSPVDRFRRIVQLVRLADQRRSCRDVAWREHWPSPGDNNAALDRDQLLHNVGNLTLLTERLNPALSNRSFDVTRPEITKSLLALNSYFQVPRWVAPGSAWDESEIQKRAIALFKIAVQIWPHSSVTAKAVQ